MTRLSSFVIVTSLVSALAAPASADTVRVDLTSITQLAFDVDTGLFEGPIGDFWTRVTIQGQVQDNSASALSFGLEFGVGYLAPFLINLTAPSTNNIDPEKWTFTAEVDRTQPVTVTIELFDADDFGNRTTMDVSPSASTTLSLTVDPATGQWSGDATSPDGCATGDASPRAQICWNLSYEAPPRDEDLVIRCLHTPVWPQPNEAITINAELFEVTAAGGLTATSGDTVEILIDSNAPVVSSSVSSATATAGPFAAAGSFVYGCRAQRGALRVFSGWRRVTVGLPGGDATLPVPILINGPNRNHLDFVLVPDVDDYTGANDAQFMADVADVIRNTWYNRSHFLERQRDYNFWLAPDTGDAVNPDGLMDTICDLNAPAGVDTRYLFADTLVLLHPSDVCRDLASGRMFSSEPTSFATVLHETGHRPFGLADEYDGDGGYFVADPFPNMFRSIGPCNDDAATVTGATSPCRIVTETRGMFTRSWFTSDPASGDLMVDRGRIRPLDERRINWLFDRCRSGSCDTGTSAGPSPAPTDDPATEPKPDFTQVDEDVIAMTVRMASDGSADVSAAQILRTSPATTLANPPQLRARLYNAAGTEISSFNLWDPRLAFAEDASGRHTTIVLPQASSALAFPLAANVRRLTIEDLELATTLLDVPVVDSDLALEDGALVGIPSYVLLNQSIEVQARVTAVSYGPVGDVDATFTWAATAAPGLVATVPAPTVQLQLPLGQERITNTAVQLSCAQPGARAVSLTTAIDGTAATHVDAAPNNNSAQVSGVVNCWNNASINLRPGLAIDVIPRWRALDVAVISRVASSVSDLRAAWIDPASLRFGSRAEVTAGAGARASFVRAQRTVAADGSFDREADVIGRFLPWQASLAAGFNEACVAGEYVTPSGTRASFLGCDFALWL